jgi:hypothetical protein
MSQSQGIGVGPSRRTVAKGAAWAVPVIAVSAAAPALASSGGIIVQFDPDASCKYPGQSTTFKWGYKLVFNVTVSEASTFCFTDVSAPNTDFGAVQVVSLQALQSGGLDTTPPEWCVNLIAGTNTLVATIEAENSANGTATFYWSVGEVTGTVLAEISNFPPCKDPR